MNRTHKRLVIGCLLIVLCVAAGRLFFPLFLYDEAVNAGNAASREKGRPQEQIVSLTISCVGDVMVHQPQIPSQYDSAAKQYDFSNNFQYVAEHIQQADLALCNVETTLRGTPYTGYPTFSSPEALAPALKEAGFDVAVTANNHMMDTGYSGMQRTLEVLREAGLHTAGSQLATPAAEDTDKTGQIVDSIGENEYTLVETAGVTVGIVAYTYAGGSQEALLVNGSRVAKEAEPLINYFRYTHLEEDLLKVESNIKEARRAGANLVIVYYHWGEEYQRSPNEWQRYIARQTAEMGADMIFASHPHVLQGMEMLEVEDQRNAGRRPSDGGELPDSSSGDGSSGSGADADRAVKIRQVPVFYSMGNFISNQRTETLDNRYTEQGMIANVYVEYNVTRKKVVNIAMDAVPTWVDRYRNGAAYTYTIVPLTGDFENNPDLVKSGHVNRARQALEDVTTLLGEEYIK